MIPLFRQYPALRDKVPYTSLGGLPTPVHRLENLGEELGSAILYIKRDDLTGTVYGGNKIRKFEFILGQALNDGVKDVITFGVAGTKHALFVAAAAKGAGLNSITMVHPNPKPFGEPANVLMAHYCGTELHHHRNFRLMLIGGAYQCLKRLLTRGRPPRLLRNRSCPLGTVGFVNAAFELREQIERGEMPEPERIYVALGSMGTAVGLLLGLKATGLESRVIPVRVSAKSRTNAAAMARLFHDTNNLLHSQDASFPEFELSERDISINQEFTGESYLAFPPKAAEAVGLMNLTEGINLEGIYTGRSLAALIADVKRGDVRGKVVLYWNTFNSRNLTPSLASIDPRSLPQWMRRYYAEWATQAKPRRERAI